MTVLAWPTDWYDFETATFRLRSMSQVASRPWTGGRSVYGPHAQLWRASFALTPHAWDANGQAISAFLTRLQGQAGLLRIGHIARRKPQRDRLASHASESFSDGFRFSDGTGFVSGSLPSATQLVDAAAAGADFIVLGGEDMPLSEAAVLRAGDLIELRPNGIATDGPNLYEVQVNAPTDAQGRTGIKIAPRLRQGFAAGDMVVLYNATGVFRLIDDDQGMPEVDRSLHMRMGFELIEAVL